MKYIPTHTISIKVLCLIAVATTMAACTFQSTRIDPTPEAATVQPPVGVPMSISLKTTDVPGSTKVYHDEYAGISLDYPSEWYIEDTALQYAVDSVVYSVSLYSWDLSSVAQEGKDLNTLPEGGTKLDITVFKDAPASLEDAVFAFKHREESTPVEFLVEQSWVLAGGLEAYYLESQGAFGVVATLISLVNDQVVYLSGYGDLAPFEAVARSLRVD